MHFNPAVTDADFSMNYGFNPLHFPNLQGVKWQPIVLKEHSCRGFSCEWKWTRSHNRPEKTALCQRGACWEVPGDALPPERGYQEMPCHQKGSPRGQDCPSGAPTWGLKPWESWVGGQWEDFKKCFQAKRTWGWDTELKVLRKMSYQQEFAAYCNYSSFAIGKVICINSA